MGWRDNIVERKGSGSASTASTPNEGNVTPNRGTSASTKASQPKVPQGSAPKESGSFENSQLSAFLGGLAEPATFGLRDKIGAVALQMTTGLPYEDALHEVRQIYEKGEEKHPYASKLGEFSGAIPMALGAGSLGGPGLQFLTGAATSLAGSEDPFNSLGGAGLKGFEYMLPAAAPLIGRGANAARNMAGEGIETYGKISNIKGDLLQKLGNRMKVSTPDPLPHHDAQAVLGTTPDTPSLAKGTLLSRAVSAQAPSAALGEALPEAIAASRPQSVPLQWGDPIMELPLPREPSIPGFGLLSSGPRPASGRVTVPVAQAEEAVPLSMAENLGNVGRIPQAKIPHDIDRLLNPLEYATDSEIPLLLRSIAEKGPGQAASLPPDMVLAPMPQSMRSASPTPKKLADLVNAASSEDPALGGALSFLSQAKFPAYRKAVTEGSINPIATAKPPGRR